MLSFETGTVLKVGIILSSQLPNEEESVMGPGYQRGNWGTESLSGLPKYAANSLDLSDFEG